MPTPLARLALAGALAASVVAGGALGAQAQESAPTGSITPRESSPASPFPKPSGDRLGAATSGAGVVEVSATCPSGQVVGKVYDTDTFESGALPEPTETYGWQVKSPDAAQGTRYASSVVEATGVPDDAFMVTSWAVPVPTTGKLYLSLSYRAVLPTGAEALVVANDFVGSAVASAGWMPVVLDVSTEAGAYGGAFYVGFQNSVSGTQIGPSTFDVDNVKLYTCVPAPNAGVRGDWTGEGTVDILGTHTNGDLYLYPGKGSGAVAGGTKVGSGWGGFTWQGSPGDVTGDKRTDLVGRRSDGNLYLYAGRGAGAFASAVKVGSSWNAMTALATPGDVNLDGRPELLARRSDGTLHLYTFATTGALRYLKQVGSGWNGMSWIIGMGDLNGDKRGDAVGVTTAGCLYTYATTSTGALGSGRQIGCGWNGMNWLTSPGDMNRDGYGDLTARDGNGALWFYRGKPGGGVYSGVQVGSGWGGMERIL